MNNNEFWENNHKDNKTYWLTGSKPDYVYNLHKINSLLNNSRPDYNNLDNITKEHVNNKHLFF